MEPEGSGSSIRLGVGEGWLGHQPQVLTLDRGNKSKGGTTIAVALSIAAAESTENAQLYLWGVGKLIKPCNP